MSDEVLIKCPTCGDHPTHNHCYVNISKGVWHCHFCGMHGTVERLAKDYPALPDIVSLLKIAASKSVRRTYPALSVTLPVILPEQEWAKQFLHERGLTIGEMVHYRICTSPTLPSRVVFPEYIGNTVAFWSARTTKKERPKWLFPKTGETLKRKSESVWGLGAKKKGSDIWITEGVFDAIAVSGVAVYGKVPSNIQLQMILEKEPVRIVIGLDRDAEAEAERLALRLKGIVPVDIQLPRASDYGAYLKAGWRRIEGSDKFRKGEKVA